MKNTSDFLEEIKNIEPHRADWPDDWVITQNPIQRRHSLIYKFYSPSKDLFVFAKSQKDAAKAYYLQNEYFSRGTAKSSVPKPYGYTSTEIIVSEWIDAPTVKKLLIRTIFASRLRNNIMHQMASWLSWFHSHSKQQDYDYNPLNNTLCLKLKRLIESNDKTCTDKELLKEYYKALVANNAVTENIKLKACIIHGDAKPSNFFYTGSKVIGFDYQPEFYGPVTTDIFRFLSHVDLHRLFFTKPQIVSSAFKDFLSAYDPEFGKLEDKTIIYLYLLTIIDRLTAINTHFIKKNGTLARRFVAFRLQKIANYLCWELSR